MILIVHTTASSAVISANCKLRRFLPFSQYSLKLLVTFTAVLYGTIKPFYFIFIYMYLYVFVLQKRAIGGIYNLRCRESLRELFKEF